MSTVSMWRGRLRLKGFPQKEFCDIMAGHFRSAWDKLNISYDRFIRTTDSDHVATVQDIVRRANERGYIYKGTYSKVLLCLV